VFLFLFYVGLGILIDLLITKQQVAVIHSRRLRASILSVAITVLGLLVVSKFVETGEIALIAGYALGTGIGTFLGVSKDSVDSHK